MVFKISVDREKCIGCQNCVNTCPEFFKMDGDKAVAKKPSAKDPGCAKAAESECPVQAISVKG